LIGIFAHNFGCDQRGLGNLLTWISAIGEGPLDEREDAARGAQKRSAAIAILDACWTRFKHEITTIRIDQRMALAPVDLFAPASWSQAASQRGKPAIDAAPRRHIS
jgi:hypothetical protein